MAATRCSGTNAVRYGTMKDNVLSLKVVMANGELMTTARRAKKSSAGYDLTRLIVGSEGTLGVITELTLKLSGIPEAISGGICPFPSVEACCNAAIMTIQSGIPVARIELLDALQVRAVNLYSKLSLRETPMLFLEFHGTEGERRRAVRALRRDRRGAWRRAVRMDRSGPEERTRLWEARHNAAFSTFTLRPGASMIPTDVCVPISRLAECVTETQRDIAENNLIAPIVGHVGDGNFHLTLLVDMQNPDEIKVAKAFNERLIERALAMDGTCTGEHGVGQGKMKYLLSRAWRAGARGDAGDQEGARSARHHEPGQNLRFELNCPRRTQIRRQTTPVEGLQAGRDGSRLPVKCHRLVGFVRPEPGCRRCTEPAPEPSCRRRC